MKLNENYEREEIKKKQLPIKLSGLIARCIINETNHIVRAVVIAFIGPQHLSGSWLRWRGWNKDDDNTFENDKKTKCLDFFFLPFQLQCDGIIYLIIIIIIIINCCYRPLLDSSYSFGIIINFVLFYLLFPSFQGAILPKKKTCTKWCIHSKSYVHIGVVTI